MKYSLDTNTCIRYINARAPKLRAKIPTIPAHEIIICSVVRAELFFGAAKSQYPEVSHARQYRFLRPYKSLSFDDKAAEVYGVIRAELEKKGMPIGSNDLLIAAIALANNLILVTHNIREFSRVEGLTLEDWEI
jgi:tRNA(fMet)-specific endonuclease VapC